MAVNLSKITFIKYRLYKVFNVKKLDYIYFTIGNSFCYEYNELK